MSLPLVQSPNALLQGQQTLVYLSPVYACLFVHVHVISSSFVASQIDKADLAEGFFAVFEGDLQDGVGPGGVGIG